MNTAKPISRRSFVMAGTAGAALTVASGTLAQSLRTAGKAQMRFRRISTQFIAALADPGATSGDNANEWGLWRRDPGPRGVQIENFARLQAAAGVAPAGWTFDRNDWWLEEHGLIMEPPEFPLPAGSYMVTGNRDARAVLTVKPAGTDGRQRWALEGGPTIYDVTHLACRSARYTPAHGACSPTQAHAGDFPVSPGAAMPPVADCSKVDYTVLLVIGVAVEEG